MTLLQFAAYKGNKDFVQYLLDKGVDPNIVGECRHAAQPTMALTLEKGEIVEQRCMWLLESGILTLLSS